MAIFTALLEWLRNLDRRMSEDLQTSDERKFRRAQDEDDEDEAAEEDGE